MYYMCLYCNDKGKNFSSVESVQQHMVDKCHCRIFFEEDAALEYAEFFDYSKSYPPTCPQEPPKEGEPTEEENGELEVSEQEVEINDDLELVLPSGSKVGHRAMRQYYK